MGIELNRRGLLDAKTCVFLLDSISGAGKSRLMRCRSIALELQKRNWVVFFVTEQSARCWFQKKNNVVSVMNFFPFHSETDSMKNIKWFIELLCYGIFGTVNLVIVDSIHFKRDDYAVLQLFTNHTSIAVIDDLARFDTPAQMVVNPNPAFSAQPYERQKIPSVLCGEQFCLIPPEVAYYKERNYDSSGPVFIEVGDSIELIEKILESIGDLKPDKACVIVKDAEVRKKLKKKYAEQSNKYRFLTPAPEERAQTLASASLAVTCNGDPLWDVYSIGIPSICILWADKGNSSFDLFKDQASDFVVDLFSHINIKLESETIDAGIKKVVETIGSPCETRKKMDCAFRTAELIKKHDTSIAVDATDEIDLRFMRKAISRLTSGCQFASDMVQNQKRLIDGHGVTRVVDAIENLQWQSVPLLNADYWRTYEDWK